MTTEQRPAGGAPPASPDRPPVEDARPPRWVLRLVSPVLNVLLRSPLHQLLSKQLMLLSVSGRRTGRTYTVPVGRYASNGTLLVSASGSWHQNLRGGAPVRLTIDGHERAGYAELEKDPDQVAQIYKSLLDRVGLDSAGLLGLKLNIQGSPTANEIKTAVAQRGIARVRLSDESTRGSGGLRRPSVGRRGDLSEVAQGSSVLEDLPNQQNVAASAAVRSGLDTNLPGRPTAL
jgi:hypothetical protein